MADYNTPVFCVTMAELCEALAAIAVKEDRFAFVRDLAPSEVESIAEDVAGEFQRVWEQEMWETIYAALEQMREDKEPEPKTGPNPNCPDCHGTGYVYQSTGAFSYRAPCLCNPEHGSHHR